MRALVTGCAGFIGSHLADALLESGAEVVGVDCFNDNYEREQKLSNLERACDWDGFELAEVDLSGASLHELVAHCDVVFHLAAEPGTRASWGARFEVYLRNNVLATRHLLEATRAEPGKRFVYASSSSVYGRAARLPTPEDVTPRPYSPYGMTKLAAEHLCRLYHANHGVGIVALRYFSVYGPRQRPDMAFSIFIGAIASGQALTVFGDGTQTRDFTYVDDIVRATRAAACAPGIDGRVYNIGGGSRTSLADSIGLIAQIAGATPSVNHLAPQEGDLDATGADISLARAELDYEPGTSLATGLAAQFDSVAGAPAVAV